MLCFRVLRNGQHLATAGVPDFGVLSTMLTWVRRPDDESNTNPELELHVGASVGRQYRENLTWCDVPVRAGDVLTVEVREDLEAEPPRKRRVDEEAGLDEVTRLRLQQKRLEMLLAEVNEALRECGGA